MNVLAYVAASYRTATVAALRGAGEVITCPPFCEEMLPVEKFKHLDLLVLNLHGLPDHGHWYGDNLLVAMTAERVRSLSLYDVGVFGYNCFLGDPQHPMRAALKQAGAEWVVAGAGENFAGIKNMQGADVLLRWFLPKVMDGWPPEEALWFAKLMVLLTPRITKAARQALADAREFEIFWRSR